MSDDATATDVYATVAPVYVGVGLLSVACTVLINLMYWLSPRLRRDHASTMINTVTTCDLLYTLKFFVSALVWELGSRDDRDSFHLFPDDCLSSVAYGQFFGMAAISWNACWIFDFLCGLVSPLRNTAGQARWYHVFSWGISAITTIIIMASAGHKSSDDHTCWLRGDSGTSLAFEVPLFMYMALAGASLLYAAARLSSGTVSTLHTRRRLLRRHTAYVIAFMTLWLFPIIHSFLDPRNEVFIFTLLDALAVSGQAAVFAAIRLSEPGALATLALVFRRIGNTARFAVGLRVYRVLSSSQAGGGAMAVDEDAFDGPFELSCSGWGAAPVGGGSPHPFKLSVLGDVEGTEVVEAEVFEGANRGGASTWLQRLFLSSGTSRSTRLGSHVALLSGQARGGDAGEAAFTSRGQWRSTGENERQSSSGDAKGLLLGLAVTGGSYSPPSTMPLSPLSSSSSTGRRSPLTLPEAMDESKATSPAATSASVATASPSVRAEGSGGWSDVSAELRDEMGLCMLCGMCQAVLAAANESGGGGKRGGDSVDAAVVRGVPAAGGDDGVEWEGGTPASQSTSSPPVLTREMSSVVVAGPAAPGQRRTMTALLRDPSTRSRIFAASSGTLGAVMQTPSGADGGTAVDGAAAAVRTAASLVAAAAPGGAASTSALFTAPGERLDVSSFAEEAFLALRAAAGVDAQYISANFDPLLLRSGALRAQFSDGASSSFFCRSLDGALVLKTVSSSEVEVLLRLLPAYAKHLLSNPASLLCRFYGCFSLLLPSSSAGLSFLGLPSSAARTYFVLMGNVFPISGRAPPSTVTFDLKGSTVNRRVRLGKGGGAGARGSLLWQDVEFREVLPRGLPLADAGAAAAAVGDGSRAASGQGGGDAWGDVDGDLVAGLPRSRAVVDQLQRDVTLLASQGLMDYSLLLQLVPIGATRGGTPVSAAIKETAAPVFSASPSLDFPAALSLVQAASHLTREGVAEAGAQVLTRWSPLAVSLCALGSPVQQQPPTGGGAPDVARPLLPDFGSASRSLVQLGVIDVLQFFDATKKMESAYKSLRYGGLTAAVGGLGGEGSSALPSGSSGQPTSADISAIDPHRYAIRFMDLCARTFVPARG